MWTFIKLIFARLKITVPQDTTTKDMKGLAHLQQEGTLGLTQMEICWQQSSSQRNIWLKIVFLVWFDSIFSNTFYFPLINEICLNLLDYVCTPYAIG